MENATKALLIAAAVLIAIVLVALGVNLLSSTGDTTEDAGKVAEQIGSSINSEASSLAIALWKANGGKTITFYVDEEKFTWPEGMSVGQAIEAGYTDSRWKTEEIDGGFKGFSFEGTRLLYDQGNDAPIQILGHPDYVPLDGAKYTLEAKIKKQ